VEITMNHTRLALAVAALAAVSACSSTKETRGLTPPATAETAVTDTRISTDFRDEGISIHYNLLGSLDRIEVTGTAPTWKGNHTVLAEADAMDKLVKFVHGQSVTTERRIRVIARTLDRARDNTLNRFNNTEGTLAFNARDVEQDVPAAGGSTEDNGQSNTSRRIADRVENTLVNTVTSITARGHLTGVRKISDDVRQNGAQYVAVYRWSQKDQDISELLRRQMR
jgi:hypothetical protein